MGFNDTSLDRLQGIDPRLAELLTHLSGLEGMPAFQVTEGLRDQARQQELYDQGASKTLNSRHLTGNATDIHLVNPDGSANWDAAAYAPLGAAAKEYAAAQGWGDDFTWGGDWGWDSTHFQVGGKRPAPTVSTQGAKPMSKWQEAILREGETIAKATDEYENARRSLEHYGQQVAMLAASPGELAKLQELEKRNEEPPATNDNLAKFSAQNASPSGGQNQPDPRAARRTALFEGLEGLGVGLSQMSQGQTVDLSGAWKRQEAVKLGRAQQALNEKAEKRLTQAQLLSVQETARDKKGRFGMAEVYRTTSGDKFSQEMYDAILNDEKFAGQFGAAHLRATGADGSDVGADYTPDQINSMVQHAKDNDVGEAGIRALESGNPTVLKNYAENMWDPDPAAVQLAEEYSMENVYSLSESLDRRAQAINDNPDATPQERVFSKRMAEASEDLAMRARGGPNVRRKAVNRADELLAEITAAGSKDEMAAAQVEADNAAQAEANMGTVTKLMPDITPESNAFDRGVYSELSAYAKSGSDVTEAMVVDKHQQIIERELAFMDKEKEKVAKETLATRLAQDSPAAADFVRAGDIERGFKAWHEETKIHPDFRLTELLMDDPDVYAAHVARVSAESGAANAHDEAVAKYYVKKATDAAERGEAARAQSVIMKDVVALLQNPEFQETGKVSSAFLPAKQFLTEAFGAEFSNLGNQELLTAVGKKLALLQKPAASGSTSDYEAKTYEMIVPGLDKSPIGNRLIGTLMDNAADREIATAQATEEWYTSPAFAEERASKDAMNLMNKHVEEAIEPYKYAIPSAWVPDPNNPDAKKPDHAMDVEEMDHGQLYRARLVNPKTGKEEDIFFQKGIINSDKVQIGYWADGSTDKFNRAKQ